MSERVSAWGFAGVGHGELTLNQEAQSRMETDLPRTIDALGVKGIERLKRVPDWRRVVPVRHAVRARQARRLTQDCSHAAFSTRSVCKTASSFAMAVQLRPASSMSIVAARGTRLYCARLTTASVVAGSTRRWVTSLGRAKPAHSRRGSYRPDRWNSATAADKAPSGTVLAQNTGPADQVEPNGPDIRPPVSAARSHARADQDRLACLARPDAARAHLRQFPALIVDTDYARSAVLERRSCAPVVKRFIEDVADLSLLAAAQSLPSAKRRAEANRILRFRSARARADCRRWL